MTDPRECFAKTLDKGLDDCPPVCAQVRWDHTHDHIQVVIDTFRKRVKNNEGWSMAGIESI